MRAPRERADPYWDNVPPPGHARCGGAKVAGYDVSQEDWDAIFTKKGRIADVQIFDKALSTEEVAELYDVDLTLNPHIGYHDDESDL